MFATDGALALKLRPDDFIPAAVRDPFASHGQLVVVPQAPLMAVSETPYRDAMDAAADCFEASAISFGHGLRILWLCAGCWVVLTSQGTIRRGALVCRALLSPTSICAFAGMGWGFAGTLFVLLIWR